MPSMRWQAHNSGTSRRVERRANGTSPRRRAFAGALSVGPRTLSTDAAAISQIAAATRRRWRPETFAMNGGIGDQRLQRSKRIAKL